MEQKFPLLKTSNLTKEYQLGGTLIKAVAGISVDIFPGEFISLVGKSGSGKSTLMHMLGLLAKPTNGELYFESKLVNALTDKEMAHIRGEQIGFVFQSFNLLARTSALDNVLLPTFYAKHKANIDDAKKILERVGLSDRMQNTPGQLSGGQQQRVAIARALINDPQVILADEPTGNLDSKSGEDVMRILRELNAEGRTVILVTHDDELAAKANRTIRLSDGLIVEDTING